MLGFIRGLHATVQRTSREIDAALSSFDIRSATAALWSLVEEANRYVAATRPWELAKAEAGSDAAGGDFDEALGVLLGACRTLAREFQPFLPAASERVAHALEEGNPDLGRRLFPKAA